MFNVNGPEIIVLAVLFLLLFGPERLPGVVMQLARWIGRFRALTDQATAEIRREFEVAAHEAEAARREFEQLSLEAKAAADSVEKETRRAVDAAEGVAVRKPPTTASATARAEQAGEDRAGQDRADEESLPSIGGERAAAAERDAALGDGAT